MNKIKIIGVVVILAVIAFCYTMYQSSLDEDFNNIDFSDPARVGDSYTGIYHRPTCPKVEAIKYGKRDFADYHEAEAAGFDPCKRCNPAEQK